MYRAPSPREREQRHALRLMGCGWLVAQVAEALGRDAHTIGNWLEEFRRVGSVALGLRQVFPLQPGQADPGEGRTAYRYRL